MDHAVYNAAGERIVLMDNPHATRAHLIAKVAQMFADMGGSRRAEKRRLQQDGAYFDTWVLDLPTWAPHVARYV